jgi:hypothetical protein
MAKVEINKDSVYIDGKEYVPKGSDLKSPNYQGDVKICVLQRGWVYIGRFSKEKDQCKLQNAFCIQTWGTTKGLGELVNGALSGTKLNKCEGEIDFHEGSLLFTISVKEEKWKEI